MSKRPRYSTGIDAMGEYVQKMLNRQLKNPNRKLTEDELDELERIKDRYEAYRPLVRPSIDLKARILKAISILEESNVERQRARIAEKQRPHVSDFQNALDNILNPTVNLTAPNVLNVGLGGNEDIITNMIQTGTPKIAYRTMGGGNNSFVYPRTDADVLVADLTTKDTRSANWADPINTDNYVANIVAENLSHAIDATAIKFTSTGKFYPVVLIPTKMLDKNRQNFAIIKKNLIKVGTEGEDKHGQITYVYINMTGFYKLFSLFNSQYALLSFNINSDRHNFIVESIDAIVWSLKQMLITGALNGLPLGLIHQRYKSIKFEIHSTAGDIKNNRAGSIRYYAWGTSVYDIGYVTEDPATAPLDPHLSGVMTKKMKVLIAKIKTELLNKMMVGHYDYPDEGDIDLKGSYILSPDAKKNVSPEMKNYIKSLLRMNEVTVKFFPRANNTQASTSKQRPANFNVEVINPRNPPPIKPRSDHVLKPAKQTAEFSQTTQMEGHADRAEITQFEQNIHSTLHPPTVRPGRGRVRGTPMIQRGIIGERPPTYAEKVTAPRRGRGRPRKLTTPAPKEPTPRAKGRGKMLAPRSIPPVREVTQVQSMPIRPTGYRMRSQPPPSLTMGSGLPTIAEINAQFYPTFPEMPTIPDIITPIVAPVVQTFSSLADKMSLVFEQFGNEINQNIQHEFNHPITYTDYAILQDQDARWHEEDKIRKLKKYREEKKRKAEEAIQEKKRKDEEARQAIVRAREITLQEAAAREIKEIQKRIQDMMNQGAGCLIDRNDRLQVQISRLKGLWTPPHVDGDTHCVLRCIFKFLNKFIPKSERFMEHERRFETEIEDLEFMRSYYLKIKEEGNITFENLKIISAVFNLNIDVWHIIPIASLSEDETVIDSAVIEEADKICEIFSKYRTFIAPEYNEDGCDKDGNSIYSRQMPNRKIDLLWHANHCYWLKHVNKVVQKIKCRQCMYWINCKTFKTKHLPICRSCPTCRKHYTIKKRDHICEGKRAIPSDVKVIDKDGNKTYWKPLRGLKPSKSVKKNSQIWVADIEAFPDRTQHDSFTPYAIGVLNLSDDDMTEPTIFYGKGCMDRFFNYMQLWAKGICYFFNGSGFDNYIVLEAMVRARLYVDSESFVKAKSKILQFKIHDNLIVRDLYLFIKSSLKKACVAWGVPADKSKKDFEHEKVFSFQTADIHQTEVEEYLKYDVISLGVLYKNYSTTMMECFQRDINEALTPSSYAMQCWRSMIGPIADEIFVTPGGEDEKIDRAAYYGGRVMCQRKSYESPQLHDDYDDIDEENCLADLDANSLYPYAQFISKFAYGKWTTHYITIPFNLRINDDTIEMYNEDIQRCCYNVAYIAPTDILTSFLIAKNDKGGVDHDLLPKPDQWYWGCEIIEAYILGYRFKIHAVKEFEKSDYIFKSYVDKCWQGRKANPKPSLKNTGYKEMANSLTGKFGQGSIMSSTAIYSVNYKPNSEKDLAKFNAMVNKVEDFQPVYDEDGEMLALIIEVTNPNASPNYPVYLSAQILAQSRCVMSRYMRMCDSYRNPARAIYYTDTDSLILPFVCVMILTRLGHVGKELGQLSCDLDEEFKNNNCGKILKAIFAAVKGPYSIIYKLADNGPLREKIRVKGIPHTSPKDNFIYQEETELDMTSHEQVENAIKLFKIQNWLDYPEYFPVPTDCITSRFYRFKKVYTTKEEEDEDCDNQQIWFHSHINFAIIEAIMHHKGIIYL